jgi:hypothetical protein
MPLNEGWLKEQLRLASEEVATWPDWKRQELYARAAAEALQASRKVASGD